MEQIYKGEYRIWGPPGCGKTRFLKNQISKITVNDSPDLADRFGSSAAVCSLTRAAAAEIASRVEIPNFQVGTLHAFAFRELGRPDVAEGKIEEWNSEVSDGMKISSQDSPKDLDDHKLAVPSNAVDQYSRLNLFRCLRRPRELWPPALIQFEKRWTAWKDANELMDFTDLIENATRDVYTAPGKPKVLLVDEAQDLSPIEMDLVLKWGNSAGAMMIAGDPYQALYSWRGASAERFLRDDLPPDRLRVLGQSYRVPRSHQELATRWVSKLSNYKPVEYRPRDSEGIIEHSSSSYRDAAGLVRSIQTDLEHGSVMVAGSCAYMIAPLLAALKDRGIPFANPWRTKRGDWNPLGAKRGTSTSSRIESFLRRPSGGRIWSKGDLRDWVDTLRAGDSLIRGAKKALASIEEHEEHHEVTTEFLESVFKQDVLIDLLFEQYPDPQALLNWIEPRMMPAKLNKAKFAIKVAKRLGHKSLAEEPRLFVGTVHSFKGAEADCSPPDEPVLTTNRGYVHIADLIPGEDKLVSFNSNHHKIHRGGPKRPDGYDFKKGSRFHSGEMLTIETKHSSTRVTGNHHLTVRWTEKALDRWAIYLMRKKWDSGVTSYRIGTTKLIQRSDSRTQLGLTMRMNHEGADAIWVLELHDNLTDTLKREAELAWKYGVPDLPFQNPGNRIKGQGLNDRDWEDLWSKLDTEGNALRVLSVFSRDVSFPFVEGKEPGRVYRRRQGGLRNRWQVRACNLLEEVMEIPVDVIGKGQEPDWLEFRIERKFYEGMVYSLDVEKWHHYISGGAVVHNCVYLLPDMSPSGTAEYNSGQAFQRDNMIRTFYVGLTRAREKLVICSPAGSAVRFN